MANESPRILVASPVRRKPSILAHFLRGLEELDRAEGGLDFVFIDDCDDPESSAMLHAWAPPAGDGTIIVPEGLDEQEYDSANDFHRWDWRLASRVAEFRNKFIEMALEGGFDHLFMVDSDLILPPDLLHWLLASQEDIVAEVFWTKFFLNDWIVPNCWIWGETAQYRVRPDEDPRRLNREEVQRRMREWHDELHVPGVHEVAGTGACILISRNVLESGADYRPIRGLGWWGEDRFFQVRSSVAGYRTYVDTHAPPLHLYRDEDLERVDAWYQDDARRRASIEKE